MQHAVSGRILVADDDAAGRSVWHAMLGRDAYSVRAVADGAAAVEAFRAEPADIVLTDLSMPGLGGSEVIARIRQLPEGADVPIVVLAALDAGEPIGRALDAGADEVLGKPVRRDELLLRVRSLLRSHGLRRALADRERRLDAQEAALAELKQQKDDMAAFVVHDLKDPITSILSNLQFMARRDELSPLTRETLDDTLSSAQVLCRMVMNLRDISRAEGEALTPHLDALDLGPFLRQTHAQMKALAELHGVGFEVDLPGEPLAVHADADLLRRVVENLLDNAFKYAPAGACVRLGARPLDAERALICVRDTVACATVEQRERLFDRYARLERDAAAERGRGLWLTFCRHAAEAQGGGVFVVPSEPAGSTFCVTLRRA